MSRPTGGSAGIWDAIAAEGTDPELLGRVVARLVGPGGEPRAMAREAVERELRPRLGDRVAQVAGGGSDQDRVAQVAGGGSDLDRADPRARALLAQLAPTPDRSARARAEIAAEAWAAGGVRAALVGDPCYPTRLAAGWPRSGGPALLAWRGPDPGLPDRPTVAIVGARRATSYGTGVAAWLAGAAGDAGVLVVSGGAVGIDAAAHGGAVGTRGGTAVVLGCGHGVAYPRAHARGGGLFDRVLSAGGWVASELPHDARPRPRNVLARNRIVAGLADAVVVVEGSERSGSLRTAACAAERGIPVLAVPGDVRAPGSAAPHLLLSDGAAPCTGPGDLLEVLAVAGADRPEHDGGVSVLPDAVRAELARRWPRPVRVGDLAAVTGVPAARLLGLLTRGRVAGEIAEGADGIRLTRAPN